MQRTASLLLLLGALLGIAGLAHASVWIAAGPARATLAVDAKGTAVVSVVSNGKHDTVVVPPKGQLYHGGSIGADVSRPARVPGLPFALAVRRTPDGTRWALQRSQAAPDGPWDVHLARWSGAPTQLTLSFDGERLTGKASFHGKPVTGTIYTLEGKHPRIYVYLDCFACPAGGGGWTRMLGVPPRSDGSFAVSVRPSWLGKRYRATLAGPNIGSTLAPDAQVVVAGR